MPLVGLGYGAIIPSLLRAKSFLMVTATSIMRSAHEAWEWVINTYKRTDMMYWWGENKNSISVQIYANKFDTLMYLYGYKLILQLKEYYLSIEDYEKCYEIVKTIEEHNELHKQSIPLSIYEEYTEEF